MEEVYQSYLKNRGNTDVRAVKSGEWEYLVDFVAMKQTNIQHENHTIRDIRRVAVSEAIKAEKNSSASSSPKVFPFSPPSSLTKMSSLSSPPKETSVSRPKEPKRAH